MMVNYCIYFNTVYPVSERNISSELELLWEYNGESLGFVPPSFAQPLVFLLDPLVLLLKPGLFTRPPCLFVRPLVFSLY